jgi:ABC-2 type transport system ATP-binding protein
VAQPKGVFLTQNFEFRVFYFFSFGVLVGVFFGLAGPFGAGKTTLIKIMTTLLLPTSGRVVVNGFEVEKQENQVRASVGCMLMGERGLYWKLTGRENLEYFAALYHFPPKKTQRTGGGNLAPDSIRRDSRPNG